MYSRLVNNTDIENRVGVVLLNWNNSLETISCIDQIRKININNTPLIVIVDNASQDPYLEKLQEEESIHLIKLNMNRGFSAGINIGIRWLLLQGCQYILVLNSDVTLSPDFLSQLLSVMDDDKDKKIGIISPKIRYFSPSNQIWFAGGKFHFPRILGEMVGIGEVDNGQYDKMRSIDFVTGCCMLIRSEVFDHVGFFDEQFFFYHEDVDFCLRTLKAGYQIWIYPQAIIWHNVSSSTREIPYRRTYLYVSGRWVFFRKHIRGFRWIPVMLWEIIRYLREIFSALIRWDITYIQVYNQAVIDGFRGKIDTLKTNY